MPFFYGNQQKWGLNCLNAKKKFSGEKNNFCIENKNKHQQNFNLLSNRQFF